MTVPYGLLNTPNADPRLALPNGLRAALSPRNASVPWSPRRGGSIWERIQRRLMPVPESMQGLLSDEDVSQARNRGIMSGALSLLDSTEPVVGAPRPTLGQDLAGAIRAGQGSFDETLGQSLQMRQFVEAQQKAQLAQQRRAAILQKYPITKEMSEKQRVAMFERMLPEFIAANDIDMVRSIVEFLKSRQNDQRVPEIQTEDLGDRVRFFEPSSGRTWYEQKGANPRAATERANRVVSAVNPATGKSEYAEITDNGFKFMGVAPGTARDAASTESERKGAALLALAEDAMPVLDAADAPGRIAQLLQRGGVREALTAEEQVNRQAGLVIADAYIRLTSGANAPEPEVQRTMQMITPMPGDKPELIARKRATRKAFMRALSVAAGRAAEAVRNPFDGVGGGSSSTAPAQGNASNVRKFLKKQ